MTLVNEIIDQARLVPMLSHSAMLLMNMVRVGDHSLQDVVRLVEHDPALTANVLKVVNAPAFGLGQPVSSLARAVSFMGDKMVVGIAIGSCSPHIFGKQLVGYESETGELWLHSLRVAIAARELARGATVEISQETAFTAGILHDIGKALVSTFLKDKTALALRHVDGEDAEDFAHAERQILGLDHAEVGGLVAERWNLPPELRSPIRFHHAPDQAEPEHRPLAYAVHVGDILAMMAGTATGADGLAYALDPGFSQFFSLEEADMDSLLVTIADEFDRTKTLFLS